ncbi:MAG: hypothetical protein FWD67_03380 [Betaproteobacteria bacterium]|nr:hypothetical protein [Betaproteobacteria bacterium]
MHGVLLGENGGETGRRIRRILENQALGSYFFTMFHLVPEGAISIIGIRWVAVRMRNSRI